MNASTISKMNGYGTMFRFITPILVSTTVMILLWGFGEMRKDIAEIRQDIKIVSKEMVFKCDYMEDQKRIWSMIDKVTDKLK